MVWMRPNKESSIKCRAKNDIFPNSRNMNKGKLCHHSCTLILNVHHFHVGVRCPDHHILPRIADTYNLIHRPNTLCRMRDSHITRNLPRVDATSLDLNIALACIRWHLTGTPLLSRLSWTFLKKSEHDCGLTRTNNWQRIFQRICHRWSWWWQEPHFRLICRHFLTGRLAQLIWTSYCSNLLLAEI